MTDVRWARMGHASNIARELRAINRVHPVEIDDHRYAYPDLKELWLSEDKDHITLTHHRDPAWQYWHLGTQGWELVSIHRTRKAAREAALAQVPEPVLAGTYVVATGGTRTIRVRCESREGPETLRGIFQRLGYQATLENVS